MTSSFISQGIGPGAGSQSSPQYGRGAGRFQGRAHAGVLAVVFAAGRLALLVLALLAVAGLSGMSKAEAAGVTDKTKPADRQVLAQTQLLAQTQVLAQTQERPLKVVALGDSLTAGYGLPAGAAFPVVLQAALAARGIKAEIANAGVSGDVAQGGLDRLDWSVPEGTDAVIVELGANDSFRGFDPAVTKQALETIVIRLKARGIAVMLAGMLAPPNMGPEYTARFNAMYREIADRHGLVLYPFFLEGVAGRRELNLPDGIHPTAEGIRVVVQRILPTVEAFLAGVRRRS